MLEIGIPLRNISGFVARLVFLQEDPAALLHDHMEFTRSFLAPMRQGKPIGDGTGRKVLDIVNHVMSTAMSKEFNMATEMIS